MAEDWRESAACAGYPTAWWYPDRSTPASWTSRARSICADCPVRAECRAWAEKWDEVGIWAGKVRERAEAGGTERVCRCGRRFSAVGTRKHCSETCATAAKRVAWRESQARRRASA